MIKDWLPDILQAVYEASSEILKVYENDFKVMFKADDSPVTRADKASNQILTECLLNTGVIVVSEESVKPPYGQRKNQPIWLVDPLDGTKEFIKRNGDFCICIALIEDHFPTFGLIADPLNQKIIMGGRHLPPALINYYEPDYLAEKHHLNPVRTDKVEKVVYSRTHYTPNIDIIVEKLEKKYGPCKRILKGSALKFFDLVTDQAQLYPRLWPTMEWDIAAGHAIYEPLGGEVVEFSTFAPLRYNKESLYNPKFIAKPRNLDL